MERRGVSFNLIDASKDKKVQSAIFNQLKYFSPMRRTNFYIYFCQLLTGNKSTVYLLRTEKWRHSQTILFILFLWFLLFLLLFCFQLLHWAHGLEQSLKCSNLSVSLMSLSNSPNCGSLLWSSVIALHRTAWEPWAPIIEKVS